MPRIAVVTDSGCDLPKSLQDQYNITTVPLIVRFGEEQFLEHELTRERFWEKASQAPPYPATSQPSAGQFEAAFAPLIEGGHHVLCLTITSKHSGTFNSAYVASQTFPDQVTVFDTLSLSLMQGYQAILAAQAAGEGRSLDEILHLLESTRSRTHLFIGLDTIEYLRRGGRADALMPFIERVARVFNIKPILQVIDGELKLLGAPRSTQKAGQRMQQEVAVRAPAEMVSAIHIRANDTVHAFAKALADSVDFPAAQVMIGEAGPVLSCQGGPGVLAAGVVQKAA
jgi:DegV family protein with EDD domain